HLHQARVRLIVIEAHAALARREQARKQLVLQRELAIRNAVVLRHELAAVLDFDLGVGAAAELPAALLRGDALDEVVDAGRVVAAAGGQREATEEDEGALHGDEIRKRAGNLS